MQRLHSCRWGLRGRRGVQGKEGGLSLSKGDTPGTVIGSRAFTQGQLLAQALPCSYARSKEVGLFIYCSARLAPVKDIQHSEPP